MKQFFNLHFSLSVLFALAINISIAQPAASFTFSSNTNCDSATVQFSNTSIGVAPLSYWWHFGNDSIGDTTLNPIYHFSQCGNYLVTLEVTDTFGIKDVDSQFVVIHCSPQAAFNFSSGLFCDSAIIQFNDASTTSDAIEKWQWSFENDLGWKDSSQVQNPIFHFLAAGNYLVTLTVSTSSGCTSSAQDSFTIHSSPIANAGSDQTICYGDSTQLHASGGNVYSWSPFESLSDANAANPFSFPIATTTYALTITDQSGCTATDSVVVIVAIPQSAKILNLDSSYCTNHEAVTLIANPSGGIFSGAGIVGNKFSPASLTPNQSYNIEYTFTDTIGCVRKDTASTFINGLPIINAGNDSAVCPGNSIQLFASGGKIYTWSPTEFLSDSSISNPVATPVSSTTYTVFGTDTNGCTNSDSIQVIVNIPSIVSAGNDTVICFGASVVLQASGVILYSWSPAIELSNAYIANPIATPTTSRIYKVTGTDYNGCKSIDSVSIIVNNPTSVSAGADTSICFGESVTLHASGGSNYAWSPSVSLNDSSSANPVATPIATTKYFLNETSVNGCGGKDSVVVTVMLLPNVKASSDTTICSGDSVQLIASGASLYVWSPSNSLNDALISNPLAFPSQNTLYTVTGINLSGCKNSDSVLVSLFNTNTISAGIDTSVCIGDTVQLNATGAEKYLWSPAQFLSDANSANPKCFPTVSTIFTLTASLGNCSVIDSVIVIVNSLPQISAGKDTSVCIGSSVQLNASGGIKYSWSPGDYLSDSLVANPFASPPYEFEYTVKGIDIHGCSNSDNVSIQVFAVPDVTISVDSTMCDGDTIPMFATGGTNYHWEPPLGLSQTEFASTLVYPPVTTTYTVTVTNQFGCTTTASAKVIVNELPNVSAGSDQFVCPGVGLQLQATGALYYFWTPSTGLSSNNSGNPVATVYSNTTYVVTGTDLKNCQANDTVNLVLLPPLQSFISNDTIICSESTAHLNAGGGINYQWLPSNSLSDAAVASPIATPSESTTYVVYVSDGVCYTDTLNVVVTVQPLPTINAGADADIISGVAYNFNVQSSEGNYSWLPSDGLSCIDCLNPIATPKQTTTYVVTVTDSIGCSSSDSITLRVGCGDDVVFVPNAFTPNDNNHNDVLYIRALGTIDLHFFRIYDRWGKMIFNTNNLDLGWNGKYNDKPMPAGVYLYEWELTCSNGDVVKKQGNVTLLR